jgi:hypothetical protein
VGETHAALGSVLTTDRCRLISVGFEIHNTTAEIYKQGSLTVAQLPDVAEDSHTCNYKDTNVAGYNTQSIQVDRCCLMASTLAPLLSVPGSQTWPAAEGVYVIPRMTKVPSQVISYALVEGQDGGYGANGRVPVLYGTDGLVATPEPTTYIRGVAGADSSNIPLCNPFGASGFAPCQVYLSGLSNASTLTISFRTVVEYFPALGSALLPLASPSPCYDPDVLRLYSEIITMAPYAVKVSENASGDYFRRIFQILSRALVLTSPLFGSFGPVVKAGGEIISNLASSKVVSKKPNKKQ